MTTEEFNQLITDYGKHVYSFCCNLTGNRIDADDLYQDTLLKAVELRHKLNSSGNPKSYLMGISVKIWQNHKKKYAVRQNIIQMEELKENLIQEAEDKNSQPEDDVIRKETILAVRKQIKRLPWNLQTVIYMYYTAEMSVEDIGRALHIPKGTVKSRLFKGRKLMKEYLEVQDYGI
jgi:RNA polymerase sigma-70 factor (ECF subfamily)